MNLPPLSSYVFPFAMALSGEDRIIIEILRRIGVDRGTCCEFGASNGISQSNTWALMHYGTQISPCWGAPLPPAFDPPVPWFGVMIEADPDNFAICRKHWAGIHRMLVVQRRITCEPGETIDDVLDELTVSNLEVLSIDIDSIDYWVFKSLRRRPSIVVIEYNQFCDPTIPLVRPYDPAAQWMLDNYFGASAAALIDLARDKGYRFVAHTVQNLLFVKEEACTSHLPRLEAHSVLQIPSALLGQERLIPVTPTSDCGSTTG